MAKRIAPVLHAVGTAFPTCDFPEFSARAIAAGGADSGVICTVCTSTFWDYDDLRECGPSEHDTVTAPR